MVLFPAPLDTRERQPCAMQVGLESRLQTRCQSITALWAQFAEMHVQSLRSESRDLEQRAGFGIGHIQESHQVITSAARRYTPIRGGLLVTGTPIGEVIREQREAILHVAAKHGATQVRLIGSVARDEARADSDVDLLVTWQEGTSLLDQAALKLELEAMLDRKVDIASDGWVKPAIRESVYRDAVPL